MYRGRLITFEGVEGAGKSTQILRAAAALEERAYHVVMAREPGGTRVGEVVRALLLERMAIEMAPAAEMFLYLAARSQLSAEIIKPALEEGRVVLLDRYIDSTLAYQGYGLQIDLGAGDLAANIARLRELTDIAAGSLRPDLTILLDVDPEVGLGRRPGAAPDRIEARDLSYHRRVREGFLAQAAREPGRIKVFDAGRSIAEVAAQVEAAILSILRD